MKKYTISVDGSYLIDVEAKNDDEALSKGVNFKPGSETFNIFRAAIIDEEEEDMTTMGIDFNSEDLEHAKADMEQLAIKHNNAQDLRPYIVPDQTIKADLGKPPLGMVPMQIVFDIATIRAYGNAKYKDPWSWRRVDMDRYVDAMLRHALAFATDYLSKDEESGLPHLHHLACNVAFLCDMLKEDFKNV